MADSIIGKKSGQLKDELEQLALDNAPEHLLVQKLDQIADAEEIEQLGEEADDSGEEAVDDTYAFSQDSYMAVGALDRVQDDLEAALLLASLQPGKGIGNDMGAGALKILMDETLATKVTHQDAFRQIL